MEAGKTTNDREQDVVHDHAPRKLTFAENVILTLKVLAILGLIGAALWGANHWTSK